ncbi:MAG: hypothetical protein K0R58_1495 [Ramlibacter sp.]|jgi:uncharacterized membrane protein YfcA|nr:hypothetical protein [Ramlibacter sp.]
MLFILSGSVLATSFLSGIFGMAGGMVLMGILLVLMSVEKAMVIHGVAQFASNGWRAVLWWRQIDWRVFRGYAAGAVLVLAAMLALQVTLSRPVVMIVMGATPFLAFLLPARWQLNVDRRGHPFSCGLICMGVQMLSGVSGPLLDTFFVRSSMNRHQVVATKAAVQTLSHAARIVFFGALLASSDQQVGPVLALLLVVSAIAGTSASKLVLDRISDKHFRQVTQRLVLVLGGCYVVAGLWLLR